MKFHFSYNSFFDYIYSQNENQMTNPIIGRNKEIALLKGLANSSKSEFVAVYGRRRVGKTFLIRRAFEQGFAFQVTGLANASLEQQLLNFHVACGEWQAAMLVFRRALAEDNLSTKLTTMAAANSEVRTSESMDAECRAATISTLYNRCPP